MSVLNFKPGDPIDRQTFMVLLDRADGKAYEAVVSITAGVVKSWRYVPGIQPPITLEEFFECEAAVKADPKFQEAARKRGVTNFDLIMVDPWSAGNFGAKEEQEYRLSKALSWVRTTPDDNGYAHPIEGVISFVDLNKMEVIKVVDHGVVPLPKEHGNYSPNGTGPVRADLKSLEITQPEGVSFTIDGHKISWQKWQIRFGFTPREGLVLHAVGYEDQGRVRQILYRASLSDMIVPYGDPSPAHSFKNAFDAGEYNLGKFVNSMELGCDCLGDIRYFDVILADGSGNPVTIKNAICLHEEDFGILWKHIDWRTGQVEVRRSRRLVLSTICTIGNYEYGFFWYFYQDGTIEFQVKLTGIISTGAVPPGVKPKYGTLVAPGLYGPIHQHFFNIRLDTAVDGQNNSVYEVNAEAEPLGPQNPLGNAFFAKETLLAREAEAQRVIDPLSGRYWKIVNQKVKNRFDEPVGYKLIPGENILPFAHPEASVIKRGNFITKHLWVTPYHSSEKHAAGEYPNQHPGGDGLPAWTKANRKIENSDVVVWYTMGHLHVVRPEDWPVMPVEYIGFFPEAGWLLRSQPGAGRASVSWTW